MLINIYDVVIHLHFIEIYKTKSCGLTTWLPEDDELLINGNAITLSFNYRYNYNTYWLLMWSLIAIVESNFSTIVAAKWSDKFAGLLNSPRADAKLGILGILSKLK